MKLILFIIFILIDIDSSAANQRIFKEQYDPAVNSWTTSAYCNPASGPTVAEYHTMVKEGTELFHNEKKNEIWLSSMTKTLIPTENTTNWTHKDATKNFDYTTSVFNAWIYLSWSWSSWYYKQ